MHMKLIIAEKISVGRSIAAVIGANQKQNGYLEGNGYIVSWCVGHLVELASPSAYDEKYAKWRLEDLPILPKPWKYTVSENTKAQFTILKRLMADTRVSSVICATDAGREGELIFRLVYYICGCQKPVDRLWISSMEDAAIQEGFENLKPASVYDRLYEAALCRAQADWLVGMNATRLFSAIYGKTLNIGRVMTPTLSLIVSREAQIEAFQSTPFYHVELDCGSFTVQSERLQSQNDAEQLLSRCNGKEAVITSVESKEKAENPPKLYDLTCLQRDANRLLGYTAQQTLDYTQSLYEKKLCTYPRTDSRYLTEHMEAGIPILAGVMMPYLPFSLLCEPPCHAARVVDGSKVNDHHAILPTSAIAGADLLSLPVGERNILNLLMVRLICAVGDACLSEETNVEVACAGDSFTTKGAYVLQKGWRMIDSAFLEVLNGKHDAAKAQLPKLNQGMSFPSVNAAIKEGKTTPPKHFTEDTLLSAMETAGVEEMPEDAEHKGLGTPATRAGILEKLVKIGFVERKGKKKATVLLPTTKGKSLITVLPEELQSPLLTAEWEQQLMQIEHGELLPDLFHQGISSMVQKLVDTSEPIKDASVLFPDGTNAIGVCPRCGNTVVDRPKSFSCSNRDCRFVMWKCNHFFKSKRKELTKTIATALLKEGHVMVKGFYSTKKEKTYDAIVVLDDTGGDYVNFRLEF